MFLDDQFGEIKGLNSAPVQGEHGVARQGHVVRDNPNVLAGLEFIHRTGIEEILAHRGHGVAAPMTVRVEMEVLERAGVPVETCRHSPSIGHEQLVAAYGHVALRRNPGERRTVVRL